MTMVDGIGTYGGAESIAREIVQRLDPDRYERTLCVTRWEPLDEYSTALDELDEAGVAFTGLERRSRFDLGPWRRLIADMRERSFDVLHAHKLGSNFWGALVAPRARVPVFVAHEHTWSFEGSRLRVEIDRRWIAPRADAFVACSRDDRRKMIEVEGIPPAKTRFIPNGIPAPEPPPPGGGERVRRELGIPPDAPVIGVVATLRRQKALDVLIEATTALRPEFGGLTVLIAGGPDLREPSEPDRLADLARSRGVADAVRFIGRRDDVPAVLAALDIGVLTSDYEGSPLSVMEYMEAGLPVVATAVGGVPDIVLDGRTGLLIPPRDPAALAGAVGEVLRDPGRAREMGASGRRRRREEFDISRTVEAVQELYEELYAQGGRASA
jgi:glycosyltransferase involved in cell wall biosynthesis